MLKLNHDVASLGLAGAPEIRIPANENCHASIRRAANLLGFGTATIRPIATDCLGRVEIPALQRALGDAGGLPTILVLQAGDTATGAYDPFEVVIPLAKAFGAWVHIDGARGLWASVSHRYRHPLSGVEGADQVRG